MTKGEAAYAALRERILVGELAPGQVLQQRVLAQDLGISTTPLREALRRLASEGLVELDSHRDARITPLRAEQARDLLELRTVLEPMAAALAAERRTTTDLAAMRAALADLAPLHDHPSAGDLAAHRRLHRAVHLASHNAVLVESLERLWDQTDRYRRFALEDPPAAGDAEGEHRSLVAAIAAGAADRAAAIMRGHVDASLGAKAAERLAQ